MIIILARHGNTFNQGDRVYRVGKRNDLSLTAKGMAQAETFADALIAKKITPCAIYCSPLQRTQQFAQEIIKKMNLGIEFQIDERLNELDYGSWSGLTDEEVAKNHPIEFKNWKELSIWPKNSNWPETEQGVIDAATSFAQDIISKYSTNDTIFVVSSAGRLRYFLKLVDNAFQDILKSKGVAVKTGNACKLIYKDGKFKIEAWNISPVEL